jgi:hypothetical protein
MRFMPPALALFPWRGSNCTVPVILFYSCVLAACISLSSNDRSTPVPGVMIAAQDSNPSSVAMSACNADATVLSIQVHTLAPSTTDFFFSAQRLLRQKQCRQQGQRYMMMPTRPRPNFVIRQAALPLHTTETILHPMRTQDHSR